MPDGLRRDPGPTALERLHRDREALALVAEAVADRHPQPVERELRRGRAADPHLVLGAGDREARAIGLDEDRGQAAARLLGVRVRHGEHDDVVRDAGVADEPLRAVDHVVVAVTDRAGPDPGRVGARVGLGEGERDQPLARGEAREPACLLRLAAGDLDRDRAQRLDREHQARRGARAAELLDREAQREQVRAEAAVRLGERDAEDVVLGEQAADVVGPLGGAVDLRRPGGDALVGELADRVAEEHLLLGEAGRSGGRGTDAHGGHASSAAPRRRRPWPKRPG